MFYVQHDNENIFLNSRNFFSIVNGYSYTFSLVSQTRLKWLSSSSSSTDKSEVKMILFVMFVIVYLINLANLGMNILIRMDPQLQTPVYFFLSHLSFCDLCYSRGIDPKMLLNLLAKKRSISFYSCALQFLVFSNFIDSESLLLAVMAYDQYKAISGSLLYAVSMSSRVCSLHMAGVYLVGMADALIHMTLAFCLCFCGSNEINHFFLWFTSTSLPFLLWYIGQWVGIIHLLFFFCLCLTDLHFRSPCLLLLYHSSSLEDPLCWRKVQSFLHMHLPPNCCGNFPGNCIFLVFQAEFILLSRWRQNVLVVLHPSDSHVKPSDLEPKEQGCETGPAKTETLNMILKVYISHTHSHKYTRIVFFAFINVYFMV